MVYDEMYKMKPAVHLPDKIPLSDTMYSVKSYNRPQPNPKSISSTNSKGSEMTMDGLKTRQEGLLKKLNQIKEKLGGLKNMPISLVPSNPQPIEFQVFGKQLFRMTKEIDALKDILCSKQEEQYDTENLNLSGNWLPFLLMHLRFMKDRIQDMISAKQQMGCGIEERKHVEVKQKEVLKIVSSLQTLVKNELPALQEHAEETPELKIEDYHNKILKLLEGMQALFKNYLENSKRLEMEAYDVITDFVISANPQNPPYSLLLLRNVLKSKLHVLLSSSLHSSVNQVDPSLLKLFRADETLQRESHHVAFTVIWKDQPMTSLMVNPLIQCEILGEANILRYFSRLFPNVSLLRYESLGPTCASEIDDWLDKIQDKVLLGSNKERQAFLKSLNSVLDSSSGITGSYTGLCDLFLWSVILQLGISNSVPRNISSWFKKISSENGVEELVPEPEQSTKEGGLTRKDFEQFLKKNGIPFQCRDHKEVFTVQALMECVKDMPGIHMKNLFLKDKKGNLFLLAARHDVQVKLNEVGTQISSKDLRFADENKLFETLGVKQGCVTLYALINDPSHKVTLLLDSHITQPNVQSEYINFHPLTNDATLGITAENVLKFVKLTGHKMVPVNL